MLITKMSYLWCRTHRPRKSRAIHVVSSIGSVSALYRLYIGSIPTLYRLHNGRKPVQYRLDIGCVPALYWLYIGSHRPYIGYTRLETGGSISALYRLDIDSISTLTGSTSALYQLDIGSVSAIRL